jgi:hypothetical protein
MNKPINIIIPTLLLLASNISVADEDSRQLVELPEMGSST